MKKIMRIIMMSLLLMITVTGCSLDDTANTITGLDGQKIERPAKIERIISGMPSNTELLSGLGLANKIVGTDAFSKKVPGVKSKVKTIDFMKVDNETLIKLKPDLVVASEANRVGGTNPLEHLRDANIPVLYLPTPKTYQEIKEQVTFLADFTNTKDKGEAITKKMDETYNRIAEIAKKIPQDKRKKVYLEISGEPSLFTVGKDTFLNDFLKIVNAQNIFDNKAGWFQPSVENIVKANPDVIITTESFNKKAVKNILQRKDFQTINAVKNKKVFVINQDLASRASQNAVKALEQLAKLIYPEYYE